MPQVTNPLLTFRVRLPRRMHLRCVVWANVAELRANTPEVPTKDYVALFVPLAEGSCIGTMHLAQTDLRNGTRAHEICHAMDEFVHRIVSELRAATVEAITNEVDSALRKAELIE